MKANPTPPCRTYNQDATAGFTRFSACVPLCGIAAKVHEKM